MVTATQGLEIVTETPQAHISDVAGNGDVDSTINSIILALESVGILATA